MSVIPESVFELLFILPDFEVFDMATDYAENPTYD